MELRERIVAFMDRASMEVTSHDRESRQELGGRLAQHTTVYIAHPPSSTVADVADVACEVESAGFRACPHLVARRIPDERTLGDALVRMQQCGITRALLVAGDQTPPFGPFDSSLDLLATGTLGAHGFTTLGVAGYPEGHGRIPDDALWDALRRKQAYADRTGSQLHIVTQFGFDATAIADWVRQLAAQHIRLPVHVGIMGPATLGTLIRYARLCGIGESLRALTANSAQAKLLRGLTASSDEMLLHILRARENELEVRIVQPHFFSFGGVARTAQWLQAIRDGAFDIAGTGDTLTVRRRHRARD